MIGESLNVTIVLYFHTQFRALGLVLADLRKIPTPHFPPSNVVTILSL